MNKALGLSLALQPHHDGSPLYVLNQNPQLGDTVKLRVRIHDAIGKVSEVRAMFSESGELFPTPKAKLVKRDGRWSWYECAITMHNPYMGYRFSIKLDSGEVLWLNTQGLHNLVQPDIHNFRLNTFASAPAWGAKAVMYQIFPDRFARSEKANAHKAPKWAMPASWGDEVIGQGKGTSEQFFGGDLWGVIEHLDHLQSLGVNLVYLTPVFPARSNHRYDASSFDHVDPMLGGDEALIALVAAAHKRGMKVMGDLTSNHSGVGHEWFQAAYKKPAAKESSFYYFSEKNTKYESWFGVSSLPKFNWNSRELRKKFIEGSRSTVAKWLKAPFNLDGWRIDVANMTGRTREEDMFLEVSKVIRKTMVETNPSTLLLGEYTGDAGYNIQGEGYAGAMTYSNFTKPVWRWFYNKNAKDTPGFMMWDGSYQANGDDLVTSYRQFSGAFPWHVRQHNMNALDTHDIPRFRSFSIPGAQAVAAAMQFSFPGIPVIWAGDEFGLEGFNGEKSRTPIPWNNERKHDKSMLPIYQALAKLRKENPALTSGSMRFLHSDAESIVYVRESAKQAVVVCVTRNSKSPVRIPKDAVPGLAKAINIYGGGAIKTFGNQLELPAGKLTANIWSLL
jgi:alpha-glucosidase